MKKDRLFCLISAILLCVTVTGCSQTAETPTYPESETFAETEKETFSETKSPETKSPETKAPETKAPETKSPETKSPETKSPETKAPETKAPETKAPETKAPETKAPETKAPETKAPETKAPETKAPETKAPETKAPETKAPETKAPETKAPETKAPETKAPETAAPIGEFKARPKNRTNSEYFTYQVNTNLADGDPVYAKDQAIIRIPEQYSVNGLPTRLVIINHGAGGMVTKSYTEDLDAQYIRLLLKDGYAVLFVNGLPDNHRDARYVGQYIGANFGGELYLRSVEQAYKWAIENYHIARDGVFVIGSSMGGLATLNLVNDGRLPVLGCVLNAPVIDIYRDCYFGGGWMEGKLGGQNFAAMAYVLDFDHCNFDEGTFTVDGGKTWNSFADWKNLSDELAKLWELNAEKTKGMNAFTQGEYEAYPNAAAITLACPCKIYFGKYDGTNDLSIAKAYLEKLKNGGSITGFLEGDTGVHGILDVTKNAAGQDISIVDPDTGEKLSPYGMDMIEWLRRYRPY